MSTSRSLNKVMLIGNLTRNPVLKSTTSGSTVCTFGLATNTTWKDPDGNLQERTEFHNIVAWNKLAEICAQILAMGMLVYLEGELRTRVWDDEKGVRHYRTEIKIDDMKLLDNKDKQGVGVEAAKSSYAEEEVVVKDDEKKEKSEIEKSEKKEEKEDEKDDDHDEKKSDDDKKNEGHDDDLDKEAEDLF
jgi:single-strand DNA-binding protein